MLDIHNFWVSMFPIFQESFGFIYIFFDVVTIIFLIDLFLTVPKMLLLGSKKI